MEWLSDISWLKDKKILTVDDNEVNLMFNKICLTRAGIVKENICIAQNGLEAVEEATRQLFDVIIMDIHMPVMNGIDAAKKIKEQYIGSDRPKIIANTGDYNIDIIAQDKKTFDDYMTKPTSPEEFIKKIYTVLNFPA